MKDEAKATRAASWRNAPPAATAESESGGNSRLSHGSVVALRSDGAVEVAMTIGKGHPVICEVLEGVDSKARLAVGDPVVVLGPETEAARGVVLGRIGRSSAKSRTLPDQLIVEAGQELVIRAGESSITLRADGKILIKGKDLVSHAKRLNRIKGGAVSIN